MGVEFGWSDVNGDGVGDSGSADTDGDGLVDVVAQDVDFDGRVDGYGADLDGDLVLDVVQADTDRDGVLDTVGWDVDGDGWLDQAAGPATGGVVVELGQPVDPAGVLGPTVVGGVPTGGTGHLTGPFAVADRATSDTVEDINDAITHSGAIWNLPDPW